MLGQGTDDRQVGDCLAGAIVAEVRVVADRERVGLSQRHPRVVSRGGGPLQESVHLAEVVLDQEALPAVVGVAVPAALEVGSQPVVGVVVAIRRQVGQVVAAVSPRQPAGEPFGDSAVVALAPVWARNSEPVRATPVEAAISCIKVRRVSMGDSMVSRAP